MTTQLRDGTRTDNSASNGIGGPCGRRNFALNGVSRHAPDRKSLSDRWCRMAALPNAIALLAHTAAPYRDCPFIPSHHDDRSPLRGLVKPPYISRTYRRTLQTSCLCHMAVSSLATALGPSHSREFRMDGTSSTVDHGLRSFRPEEMVVSIKEFGHHSTRRRSNLYPLPHSETAISPARHYSGHHYIHRISGSGNRTDAWQSSYSRISPRCLHSFSPMDLPNKTAALCT